MKPCDCAAKSPSATVKYTMGCACHDKCFSSLSSRWSKLVIFLAFGMISTISTLTHLLHNRHFTWDVSQKRSFWSNLAAANPNVAARLNTSGPDSETANPNVTATQTCHFHKTVRLRSEVHHLFCMTYRFYANHNGTAVQIAVDLSMAVYIYVMCCAWCLSTSLVPCGVTGPKCRTGSANVPRESAQTTPG